MHDISTDIPAAQSGDASPALATTLRRSHGRSIAYGLKAGHAPDADILGPAALDELRERNIVLGSHARPVMEQLYSQIAGTRSMVLLSDRHGTILQALGGPDFLDRAQHFSLRPGAAWSEESRGTNAIGTALAEGEPVQIHGPQHFLQAHRQLSCTCAPIADPLGEWLGALDISGDRRSHSKHMMALVRMSAQMIENHLFRRRFDAQVQLHFHARPEFVGTLFEGMAAFDPEGRFLSANRSAAAQLGMPLRALQAHTFGSLFSRGLAELLAHRRTFSGDPVELQLRNAMTVTASLRLREPAHRLPAMSQPGTPHMPGVQGGADAADFGNSRTASSRQPGPAPQGARGRSQAAGPQPAGLAALRTGDAAMSALLDRLQCLAGRDIPVLLMGETGTGKEILARAIHHDSPRRSGPMVAVNCAALPEQLIESELFGYEEGAFTGARRKGSSGRILQADGGTLFLDEIGDMPLVLQARLLRVLQEREVMPLGGTRPVPVDVAIVCATHRDLRALRASGGFRDDLYWRINGLVVQLPPLRLRSDLPVIAARLMTHLESAAGATVPGLDPAVLSLFARHPWPGNIRQLASLLRTAVALNPGEPSIRPWHLPQDFFEDIDAAAASAVASPAAQSPPAPAAGAGIEGASLQALTQTAIEHCLRQHHGNVSAAARALGIARNTLYRRLRHRC